MGFYHDRIIPWLIHLSMRQPRYAPYRSRVVPAASGRVLEIGIGSGLNLPFYSNKVSELIGLDPSAKLLDMIRGAGGRLSAPLALIEGSNRQWPRMGVNRHHQGRIRKSDWSRNRFSLSIEKRDFCDPHHIAGKRIQAIYQPRGGS